MFLVFVDIEMTITDTNTSLHQECFPEYTFACSTEHHRERLREFSHNWLWR